MKLNLKLRAGAEREFAQKLASGRHRERGGAIKKSAKGGYFQCRRPGVMSASDGWRYGNASSFMSIIPPGVGTAIYRVARRATGGGTERSAGINWGGIVYRG